MKNRLTAAMVAALGVCIAALTVYCLTLAPGLVFIDSGELAAVCATLGIAHPTGYPLYTLIGWLLTRLPGRPVLLLNLFSAVCAALSVAMVYAGIAALHARDKIGSASDTSPALRRCICAAAALLWAWCGVVWSTATATEVYALHALFTTCHVFIIIKLMLCTSDDNGSVRLLYALALLLGLGLAHHLGTVLILPGVVAALAARRDLARTALRHNLKLGALFLTGLTPYLYLPLRARQFPALNWGNPQTWENFIRHVTGSQYRVWMFASMETFLRQTGRFFSLAAASFGYAPLLLVPFGILWLYRRNRAMLGFTLIVFIADLFYAANYDISDIDPYFLPALLMCCLWMGAGLIRCAALLRSAPRSLCRILPWALCLAPVLPFAINYQRADQSKNRLVEQYTGEILRSVAADAIVLSYQWDYFCSPLYYLQLVENQRPDVTMIEVQLLRRSWYLTQLEKNHPDIMRGSELELATYRRELHAFENGLPYDPAVIQSRYIGLINALIARALPRRPVYVTCEIEPEIGAGLQRVPEGLVFRLYPAGTGYVPFDSPTTAVPDERAFRGDDRYHAALKSFYAIMLASRGLYELYHRGSDRAFLLIQKASALCPDHAAVRRATDALEQYRAAEHHSVIK